MKVIAKSKTKKVLGSDFGMILRDSVILLLRRMFRDCGLCHNTNKLKSITGFFKKFDTLSDEEFDNEIDKYNSLEQYYIDGIISLKDDCKEGAEFLISNYAGVKSSEISKYAKIVEPFAKQIFDEIVRKLDKEVVVKLKRDSNLVSSNFPSKINDKVSFKGKFLNSYSNSEYDKENLITNNHKNRSAGGNNLKLN